MAATSFTGKITKDAKLSYKASGSSYTQIEGVISMPGIGGQPNTIDTTDLSHGQRTYILGIKDPGGVMEFSLTHNKTQFSTLKALENQEIDFKIELPDDTSGTSITWKGYLAISIDAIGVDDFLKDVLSISPSTEFTFA